MLTELLLPPPPLTPAPRRTPGKAALARARARSRPYLAYYSSPDTMCARRNAQRRPERPY